MVEIVLCKIKVRNVSRDKTGDIKEAGHYSIFKGEPFGEAK